ncbi:hypothetical protein RhiirA1_463635 [Rhizophagus irregularis]|uniref:Uncharacterized protein n=1 Tax=Rhizophagus irregularis TaxID=588596 RepID=A0A2N0RJT1_9GLOM|nr:hypothetical protein RhiirA1_463635 [Rhizophagus irregularis]
MRLAEKFIQEVSKNDSSTNCSNTIAVEMRISTFSLLYEKLRNAEDFADRVVQEAIICLLSNWESSYPETR